MTEDVFEALREHPDYYAVMGATIELVGTQTSITKEIGTVRPETVGFRDRPAVLVYYDRAESEALGYEYEGRAVLYEDGAGRFKTPDLKDNIVHVEVSV